MNRFIQYAADKWKGKPEGLRSPEWPRVEKEHLRGEPTCQWCGGTEMLQVHHMKPFHLHPELELDDSNLITLCEEPGRDCHLKDGHLDNWRDFNPDIRSQCQARQTDKVPVV